VQDAGGIALATRTVGKLTAALDTACSFAWSPGVLAQGLLPEVRIADRTLDGTARIRKPPAHGRGTKQFRRRGRRAATRDRCRLTRSRPGLRVTPPRIGTSQAMPGQALTAT
jgi:hypothetical protein